MIECLGGQSTSSHTRDHNLEVGNLLGENIHFSNGFTAVEDQKSESSGQWNQVHDLKLARRLTREC